MESMRRENHVLRVAVALLFCGLVGDVSTIGQQGQRLPGPGAGVVDVQIIKEAEVTARQRGEWRVRQEGDWRVNGTVATLPAMPPIVKVGGVYTVRGPSLETVITVRALHESGWARVSDESRQEHWINLAAMSSIIVVR